MSSSLPLVSVVLPVYNAGPYLGEAIESILSQTLRELELLVVDDCSTDDSLAVARRYEATDSRVRVLASSENLGRSFVDNWGQDQARAPYIAKMDADDVALPHRLQTQYDFLEGHPEVDLTSSWLQTFGTSRTVFSYPAGAEEIRSFLLFNMPVGNPTVFFRRSLITEKGLRYDEEIKETFGEDYEWVARVIQVARIVNQPEVLLNYRTFPPSIKADFHAKRTSKSNQIRERVLQQAGFAFNARQLHVHNTIAHYPFVLGDITLAEAHDWLLELDAQNHQLTYAESAAMRRVLAERWFWTCYHNPDQQVDNYAAFWSHELSQAHQVGYELNFKFWLKNKIIRYFKR
ncbi:MAG: glycosyltransferase family 2 protein [Hymenobacter sp.]|nr:MAG: glycosyltransferase family 2 protein [Hymenobacter sp.]